MISVAGIHFEYISCCYVGQNSDKLCGRQEQPFVNRVRMEFQYITKVPYYIGIEYLITSEMLVNESCMGVEGERTEREKGV